MEFKTQNDIQQAARKMVESQISSIDKEKGFYFDILNQLKNIDTENESFNTLASLLALPENSFILLAPIFLNEFAKYYKNINNMIFLSNVINISGLKVEDIEGQYIQLCSDIDSQLETKLSLPKRDFLKQLIGYMFNAISETEGIAKKTILIPIEFCKPNAKMPAYAHLTDAGMDVYALEDITIAPGETKLIPLGIKVALPAGYELQVRPKSGRCLKTKLRVANTPGTIDAGYRDEIGVIIDNIDPPIRAIHFGKQIMNGDTATGISETYFGPDCVEYGSSYTIGAGEKFAQLVLSEVPKAAFYEVTSVAAIENDGRCGGFGSSSIYAKDDSRYGSDLS